MRMITIVEVPLAFTSLSAVSGESKAFCAISRSVAISAGIGFGTSGSYSIMPFLTVTSRMLLKETTSLILSIPARVYWDGHTDIISQGVIYGGKLEKYFQVWQKEHLAKIHSVETIEHLLTLNDCREQKEFFEKEWATPLFEENFKQYFGNYNLQKGRDPALFKYVEMEAGTYFYNRFKYICTALPIQGNYYLEFFLTSQYRDLQKAHPYLQESNYLLLRSQLDKVQLVNTDLESFLSQAEPEQFSKANLSNLFEYISEENAAYLLELMHPAFRKGGRIAYWNLMVSRSRPETLANKFEPHKTLSQTLWQQDKSWFYRDFVVEEIL